MIGSPKARFLADAGAAKRHADTVTSVAFQDALQSALLEFSLKCSKETNPDAGYWKSQGAFEFAKTLCNLHNPRADSTLRDYDNLI